MQKMRQKGAVQMNDQACNAKDSIYIIYFWTEVKRACDSLQFNEGTVDTLSRKVMNGPLLATSKKFLALA